MESRLALALAAAAATAFPSFASAQRSLGIDVSAWQGELSTTNWSTLKNTNDRDFVFIRSSRGGTTGFYNQSDPNNVNGDNTLSQRYDDPYFVQNITRATNAGLLAGSYHFSRPDIIASTPNSGGIANTGTDEANHFIQMAGAWMRPGYLLPVHDFEDGDGVRTDDQMAQFCIDFSNRINEVMQIRPAIYVNGNYAHNILGGASLTLRNQVVAAYPTLWSARWPNQADPDSIDHQNAHPQDTFTNIYGPWDDAGQIHPWAFWQYASTARLSGYKNGTANIDVDVAQGGIEFVKDYLVPALWWGNVNGDWATDANWNSGQTPVAPVQGPGQVPRVGTLTLPVTRAAGETVVGNGGNGVNDTVILDRPAASITVTHSGGIHNIRKLYMREALNITGGSLTVNYVPHPDSTPISAQFSGPVTLSGSGAFSVHTLQVDAARTFALNGGTLTLNTINLMPGAAPAKINVGGNVIFNALAGSAAVIKNGAGSGTSGSIDLTGGTRTFTVNNGASATDLLISAPVTNGSLTKQGTGTLALSNATLNAATINSGTLEVATGGTVNVAGALAAVDGTLTVKGTANAGRVTASTTIAVAINGGRVNVTPNGGSAGLSRLNHLLSITNGGKLDLNNNDLLVDYATTTVNPYAQVRQWVIDGRNGASGIISTAALGSGNTTTIAVIDNADLNRTTWLGSTIDATTIIGKYTYFGDANLDGAVTGDDYLAVDSSIGVGAKWIQGDFNYDGLVTGDDYLAIDANLGRGTPTPLAFAELKAEMVALHAEQFGEEYLGKLAAVEAGGFQIVPEPAGLALVIFAATSLLARRRRDCSLSPCGRG